MAEASGDWRGAIILGARAGLRLGDVAQLRWEAIDMEAGILSVETQKTGQVVVLPLHPDCLQWLSSQRRGIGKANIFPALASIRTGGAEGLSRQFRRIMEAAGVTENITQADGRKGRARSSKSFHSLRHGFISELANQGVVADVRKSLVGHTDSKTHAVYTHHNDLVRHEAISKLPPLMREGA